MAKELINQIKLQVPAGSANPAPPVGPALGVLMPDGPAPLLRLRAGGVLVRGGSVSIGVAVLFFNFVTVAPISCRKAVSRVGATKAPLMVRSGSLLNSIHLRYVGRPSSWSRTIRTGS